MRTSAKNLVIMAGLLMLCGLLVPASAPAGDPVYITDILTIGLRQNPDPKSTVIKALKSDTALEVLEKRDNYLRVRTPAGDEGWIPKQHVSSETPKTQIIAALKTELAGLKERAQPLPDASGDQTVIASQLAELTERYNTLREQSSHVTELAQELEALRGTNAKLTSDLDALRQEGNHLRRTDMIPWFLAGGGVFLAGFIIARLSSGKKKKSFY